MKNLFNLDINQIRHENSEVLLMRLDGVTIYEAMYGLEYTVDNSSSYLFSYYGLPKIYSNENDFEQINYNKIEITLLNGTKTSNTNIPCDSIAKVKLWYPVSTCAIKFDGTSSHRYEISSVENCNTSSIQDMENMFYYCDNLTTLNTGYWDVSKVTNMRQMFALCYNLTTLNMSNWDVSNLNNTGMMFYNCSKLVSVGNLSNWNTRNLDVIQYMFYNCGSLTELDLSNWNTGKVTNLDGMFYNCYNLTSLDLSNWDVGSVDSYYDTFRGCSKLVDLKAPRNINYSISFGSCTSLSHDSLMSIINNLMTTTKNRKLTLGSTNLAKLTPEEKAIATNKGWILA